VAVDEPSVRLGQLLRWEQSGAHWRVLARTATSVELALLTCDGGEEMDRWASGDADLLAYVGSRTTDADPR